MDPREIRFYNPFADLVQSHNRLPHREQFQATYFLTFRLADSLPQELIIQWKLKRKAWLDSHPTPWTQSQESDYHRKFSSTIERWLDAGYGQCPLKDPTYRNVVKKVLGHFDNSRCYHFAWVIMPNHVHTLTTLIADWPPKKALQSWKRQSTHEIGELLGKDIKSLWQKDYYDRLIRDRQHFANCVRYIRRNPEHARLPTTEYSPYESDEVRGLD